MPPPYTPRLHSLQLGYTSSAAVDLAAPSGGERAAVARAPLRPGAAAARRGPGAAAAGYEHAGELYVGLSGTDGRERVALLFEVAEGSADPDLPPPVVSWSSLTRDGWRPLPAGSVLADATLGLLQSGVVELALPEVEPSDVLPADLAWVRVTRRRRPAGRRRPARRARARRRR